MWKKILGSILFLSGFSIVIFFPDVINYQAEEMSKLGVTLGILLCGFGMYLMVT